MIGVAFYAGVIAGFAEAKSDLEQVQNMRASLPKDDFDKWMAERESARREREIERRHREFCEAIRSTSFWRFGG